MTETPQPDQGTKPPPIATQAEPLHDTPVSDASPCAEDTPVDEITDRKQDTMRDEIRAGWSRALRRG